jgi:hypothetical protein
MTPALKSKLALTVRECSDYLISRGFSKDKKLLRYNDISYTYRVVKLMQGSKYKQEVDRELVYDLVGICFKEHPLYSGESVKTWAWMWAMKPATKGLVT